MENKIPVWNYQPDYQWEFQDPKLEVPTMYKAYVLGLCKEISQQNMILYGTVPPTSILGSWNSHWNYLSSIDISYIKM